MSAKELVAKVLDRAKHELATEQVDEVEKIAQRQQIAMNEEMPERAMEEMVAIGVACFTDEVWKIAADYHIQHKSMATICSLHTKLFHFWTNLLQHTFVLARGGVVWP